ncbi:MAG: integration host factor subunit beta [Candidatus Cloacimonetes bacterium]|nr:integration host factor subunit beta [Candidatus Cloacimonadota bacterium]
MTKADLVKNISTETGIIRKDAAVIVDSFLEAIKESLKNGSHIEIRGFGTFKLKARRPRMGRNPKTNVTIPVPERVVPTFKFSRSFKDELFAIEDLTPHDNTKED